MLTKEINILSFNNSSDIPPERRSRKVIRPSFPSFLPFFNIPYFSTREGGGGCCPKYLPLNIDHHTFTLVDSIFYQQFIDTMAVKLVGYFFHMFYYWERTILFSIYIIHQGKFSDSPQILLSQHFRPSLSLPM